MRKALIETATGLVVNIIAIKDGAVYKPDSGMLLVDYADGCEIDGTWDGSVFLPAPALEVALPRFESEATVIEADATMEVATKDALANVVRSL